MHASSTLRALSFFAVSALLAVGCKQGEGEPCEVLSDCAEGLICCQESLSGTDLPLRRGVCQDMDTECDLDIPVPMVDAGPRPDSGVGDAGQDASAPDAGTDAGPPDAGPPDAGPPDAGTDAA